MTTVEESKGKDAQSTERTLTNLILSPPEGIERAKSLVRLSGLDLNATPMVMMALNSHGTPCWTTCGSEATIEKSIRDAVHNFAIDVFWHPAALRKGCTTSSLENVLTLGVLQLNFSVKGNAMTRGISALTEIVNALGQCLPLNSIAYGLTGHGFVVYIAHEHVPPSDELAQTPGEIIHLLSRIVPSGEVLLTLGDTKRQPASKGTFVPGLLMRKGDETHDRRMATLYVPDPIQRVAWNDIRKMLTAMHTKVRLAERTPDPTASSHAIAAQWVSKVASPHLPVAPALPPVSIPSSPYRRPKRRSCAALKSQLREETKQEMRLEEWLKIALKGEDAEPTTHNDGKEAKKTNLDLINELPIVEVSKKLGLWVGDTKREDHPTCPACNGFATLISNEFYCGSCQSQMNTVALLRVALGTHPKDHVTMRYWVEKHFPGTIPGLTKREEPHKIAQESLTEKRDSTQEAPSKQEAPGGAPKKKSKYEIIYEIPFKDVLTKLNLWNAKKNRPLCPYCKTYKYTEIDLRRNRFRCNRPSNCRGRSKSFSTADVIKIVIDNPGHNALYHWVEENFPGVL